MDVEHGVVDLGPVRMGQCVGDMSVLSVVRVSCEGPLAPDRLRAPGGPRRSMIYDVGAPSSPSGPWTRRRPCTSGPTRGPDAESTPSGGSPCRISRHRGQTAGPGGVQGGVGGRRRDQVVVGAQLDQPPPSTTPTRSARSAVDSRWAITTTVRPSMSRSTRLRPAPRCRGRGWTSPRRARAPPDRPGPPGPATRAASRRRTAGCPLAHLGVEALGEQGEALAGADRLEGGIDLGVGGPRPGDADVVADGAVEQEPLLRDDHDPPPQRRSVASRRSTPPNSTDPSVGS